MAKIIIVVAALFLLVGCAEIKPLQLPPYNPPDFSSIARPKLPVPVIGKDVFIDEQRGTITYTLTGQNLLTAEVENEKAAWEIIEMMKQVIGVQGELIKQKDHLIVIIDLKRQYAERQKLSGDLEKYASWLITVISWALMLAK